MAKPGDKILAEWFWTDRWMGSRGFLLPMEARGIYREMLTQAWRRGASLPNDHEAIRRAIGATEQEWKRSWPMVEKFWRATSDGLVNDTQLDVYAEAKAAQSSARGRAQAGAQARHKHSTSTAPDMPSVSDHQSSIPSESQRDVEAFAELWQTQATGLPRIETLTAKRRRHVRMRLTERPLTEWASVIRRIAASAFCRGENDRGWVATFDWLIGSPDVGVKVLEGKYDDRPSRTTPQPTSRYVSPCPHTPTCLNTRVCCQRQDQERAA